MMIRTFLLACSLVLAGCADMPLFDTRPMPATRSGSLGGIYEGTISLPSGENTTVAIVALDSGETRFVAATGLQMTLTLSGPPNRLSGSGRMFASGSSSKATDKALADGSQMAGVTVEAMFIPRISISGTYSGRGGNGRFNARYLPLYERASNLAKLAGTYRSFKQGSSFIGTIDRTGRLTGNDDRGAYEGQLSLLSPAVNVYRAQITYRPIGQAPIALTGLATLNDYEKNNDTDLLQMQLSNDERHFFSQIRRLR